MTLNHQRKSCSVRKSAKSILQRRLKRPIFSHRCSECAVVVHHPNCEPRVVDHSLVSCGSDFLRDVTYTTHIYGKFALHFKINPMNLEAIIPILGMLTGIIIPVAVFIWQYYDAKGKRDAVVEIAKHIDDPSKLEELLALFDERKKEPIDYRRGGVITLFVGVGLFFLGLFFLGNVFKGIGALVGLIGVGTMIAGYLYPNTEKELTNAVDQFEKK